MSSVIEDVHQRIPGLPFAVALQEWQLSSISTAALAAKEGFVVSLVMKSGETHTVKIPLHPQPSCAVDAKAQLDEVYHRLLAPKVDWGPASIFLFLLAVLFGLIIFPGSSLLAPVRSVALFIVRSDFGLRVLLGVTVAIHVCEAAAAAAIALRLRLRKAAVVRWTLLTFAVGAAALKNLGRFAPLAGAKALGASKDKRGKKRN